jgi:hypothetical protein
MALKRGAAKLELVELDREVITQEQLEGVEWLRKWLKWLKGWKERPDAMGRAMARDMIRQYRDDLAMDERNLGEALKRGAEIEAGPLTEAVLGKPSASSRRLWREWARGHRSAH